MNPAPATVLATLADLVAIPSVNPAYPGGVPEEAVARYIEAFFAARGIATSRQTVAPGRYNVLARVPGRDPGRRVLLEAHMDTVSVETMTIDPYLPRIEDGRLYGRGSCDTKAGLAGMMHALAAAAAGPPPSAELCLAAVVDEEHGFAGVLALAAEVRAEAALVAEPTGLRLVAAHKGVLRGFVHTRGRAAHSARPELGVNAIYGMARVLAAVEAEHERLAAFPHPLLGPATLSAGTIQGGEQVNLVPENCRIALDRRLLPGEDPQYVWSEFVTRLLPIARQLPGLAVWADPPFIADPALETTAETPAARAAQAAARATGLDPALTGVPFGSDASKLARAGIPSLVFGPGHIERAHAAIEYVECDQVLTAADFYLRFLEQFR